MTSTIYALTDPRTDQIMYIGRTRRKRRLYEHIQQAKNGTESPKCLWIRELLALGLSPVMADIAKVMIEDERRIEEMIISDYKTTATPLLNSRLYDSQGATQKPDTTHSSFAIRIDVRIAARLEEIASGQKRSRNGVIERMLESYIKSREN